MDGKKLTPKQRRFVNEYLIDLNGSAAATRAGYSAKSAKRIAWQLLERTEVKTEVQRRMDARADRTEITADEVLKDIRRVGGKAEDAEDWGAALKSLELQGKHLKMFTDKHEHTGENGGPVRINGVIQFVAAKVD